MQFNNVSNQMTDVAGVSSKPQTEPISKMKLTPSGSEHTIGSEMATVVSPVTDLTTISNQVMKVATVSDRVRD